MAVYELVIFDCDGVLVDSEPLSAEVLLETLREAGVALDEDVVYRRFLGRSMARVAEILLTEFGVAISDDRLATMRARLYARFRAELQPIPGLAEAVRRIGPPYCVASSSQVERVRLSLEITGLAPLFEPHIFSAAMVPRGKPAPDLFLHAAAAMGAPAPGRCVVVEDSAAGVEAAKRAGMRVLAFVGGGHAAPAGLRAAAAALSPDAVFDDMRALPDLLTRLGARRGGQTDGAADP